MHTTAHTLCLLPAQCRLINAAEGLRLQVHSGCLWLTRPGDATDHFLVAGDSLELREALVLIQSDRHPGAKQLQAARYQLAPLRVPARENKAFDLAQALQKYLTKRAFSPRESERNARAALLG